MRDLPKPPLLLALSTLIVLAGIVAFIGMGVPLMLVPSSAPSPFAFFDAIVLLPLACVVGTVVFRSVFSRSSRATTAATALYFVGAGFALYAVIANVGEALADRQTDAVFLLAFGAVGLSVAAYLAFCAWLSLQWGRRLRAAAAGTPGYCEQCGYDLRGLQDPRCPECGTPFDPPGMDTAGNADA